MRLLLHPKALLCGCDTQFLRAAKAALTVMNPSREAPAESSPVRPEDEETEARYLDYLKRAQSMDFSEFDDLNVVYHSGRCARPECCGLLLSWLITVLPLSDAQGRTILVIAPVRLGDPLPDMDKFTLYLLRLLDPLVNSDYVLVYLHSYMNDRTKPDFSWMKNVYEVLCSVFRVCFSSVAQLLFFPQDLLLEILAQLGASIRRPRHLLAPPRQHLLSRLCQRRVFRQGGVH